MSFLLKRVSGKHKAAVLIVPLLKIKSFWYSGRSRPGVWRVSQIGGCLKVSIT